VPPDPPVSAAAERNRHPILEVLRAELPRQGKVLEIASGGGQHVAYFAEALPGLHWQPTEPDVAQHDAIAHRILAAGLANVAPPRALDVMAAEWPVTGHFDAMLCINMVHISPWAATLALFDGACRHLAPAGRLILYGPYLQQGTTAPSNLEFDASLRRRNPAWGLRDLDAVTGVAASRNLRLARVIHMPANNLSLVFSWVRE
jgi:SAM-dependent methyltransferase